MTTYTTSQTIKIINDIAEDSKQIWLMLNESAIDILTPKQIKDLIINIMHKDSEGLTRFNMYSINNYLETFEEEYKTIRSFYYDCLTITKAESLSWFLFN